MDRECALVTGATSGIGWATACALAKRGAVVGLLGRRREKAEELAFRGKPDEVAKTILHLTSEDASYSNGMVYSIDGGSTAGYFFSN